MDEGDGGDFGFWVDYTDRQDEQDFGSYQGRGFRLAPE